MCSTTKKLKSGILNLPIEIKTIILREVFRGATVDLATPYSLPHVRQLVNTNKTLSVFAVEGLAGEIEERLLLYVNYEAMSKYVLTVLIP